MALKINARSRPTAVMVANRPSVSSPSVFRKVFDNFPLIA